MIISIYIGKSQDILFSFLPLAHTLERCCELAVFMAGGAAIMAIMAIMAHGIIATIMITTIIDTIIIVTIIIVTIMIAIINSSQQAALLASTLVT